MQSRTDLKKPKVTALNAQDLMTTFDVAKEFGVTIRSVQLWVEQGILEAWKTPGGHRRILRESFNMVALKRSNHAKAQVKTCRLKIVIVDDNAETLMLYRLTIQSWKLPIDVMYTSNGWAGIIGIAQTFPDLLITDLKMPELDGFSVIKAIRGLDEFINMVIIVVSGISRNEITNYGFIPDNIIIFEKNPVPFMKIKALAKEILSKKSKLVST